MIYEVIYVGNVPITNNVCFSFPFFFFPLLTSNVPSPMVEETVGGSIELSPSFFCPHALEDGILPSPKIFFNDWLPLAVTRGDLVEIGNVGNKSEDNLGELRLEEAGVETTSVRGRVVPPDDHAVVVVVPCRAKVFFAADKVGKVVVEGRGFGRSGGPCVMDVEAAACATRSQT